MPGKNEDKNNHKARFFFVSLPIICCRRLKRSVKRTFSTYESEKEKRNRWQAVNCLLEEFLDWKFLLPISTGIAASMVNFSSSTTRKITIQYFLHKQSLENERRLIRLDYINLKISSSLSLHCSRNSYIYKSTREEKKKHSSVSLFLL